MLLDSLIDSSFCLSLVWRELTAAAADMSAIWDCADAKLTFCIGRLRGRLSAFSLRKGDPGPDDDSEVLTKGSICDVLAKVPSLSRLRVTLKKGDGGDGGTTRRSILCSDSMIKYVLL